MSRCVQSLSYPELLLHIKVTVNNTLLHYMIIIYNFEALNYSANIVQVVFMSNKVIKGNPVFKLFLSFNVKPVYCFYNCFY